MTLSNDGPAVQEQPNLLLASNKVDGTRLVSRDDDSLGTVYVS